MAKIRIIESLPGVPFPYGRLPAKNQSFIMAFVGEEFTAELVNRKYYKLQNGMYIHINNVFEIEK